MPGAWLDDKLATEEGAEFFIEPGPYPSGGWIHLPAAEALALKFKKGGHTLKMTDDGDKTITIKPVFISSREDAGPGLTKVNLVDLRYFWKYLKITAQYNILNDDKKTFNVKTTPNELTGTGYKFKEIVNKLLDVLTDLPSGVTKPGKDIHNGLLDSIDSGSIPMLVDVKWEYVPAGEALAGILQLFGGTVSVSTDGNIVVAMPGENEWTNKASKLKEKTVSGSTKNDTTAAVKKPC
jgi:hypothetical protein